jgi:MFS family permease
MKKHKLPGTVVAVGLVSFFNDLASEMVTPFIPVLIATVLGAGPVVLGLVEGAADAAASFLKLWAGRYSDGRQGRRKQLMVFGYGLSNLARPLLALVSSWGALLLLRSLDRAGKGLRNAPRDALLADSVHSDIHGFAYGFHRAMDNGGALGGTLLAVAALSWLDWSVSEVILWSAVPGVLVMLVLILGVHEAPRAIVQPPKPQAPLAWALLSHNMRRYLMVLVLFTFARVSESFILLRGNELGMGVVQLLLLWAALNFVKSGAALLGGRLADAFGRRRLTMISWSGYATGFVTLGLAEQGSTLWACTLLYGLLAGLGEGSERALISLYADERERGTAFGWYHLAVGLSAIPAGVLFGTIWHYWNAGAAFLFAGALALLCALLLRFWRFNDQADF